ncbi:helix-turn-helix domain-containing protein [Ligilactobacillus equi]|uniref:helix-turn-helix domain-containing protein n=1 Tax=Ligilactobacillus equi TaxID=137357 RepID=UPI002ED0196B
MINDHLEPGINRKVAVAELLSIEGDGLVDELAQRLTYQRRQVLEAITSLQELGAQIKLDNDYVFNATSGTQMSQIISKVYQESKVLQYLRYAFLEGPTLSNERVQEVLGVAQASIYRLRKKAGLILESYDLQLVKNEIQGNELSKRTLIALLSHRYGITVYTNSQNTEKLVRKWIIANNKQVTEALLEQTRLQVGLFERLLVVGLCRREESSKLDWSDDALDNFKNWWVYDAIKTSMNQYLPYKLTEKDYEYVLYCYITTDNYLLMDKWTPERFEEGYDKIYAIPKYAKIAEMFTEFFEVDFFKSDYLRKLILEIFKVTFYENFVFRPDFYAEERIIQHSKISKVILDKLEQIAQKTFKRKLPAAVNHKTAMYIQGYLFLHEDFQCTSWIVGMSHVMHQAIVEQANLRYEGSFKGITYFAPGRNCWSQLITDKPEIILVSPHLSAYVRSLPLGPKTTVIDMSLSSVIDNFEAIEQAFRQKRRQEFYELIPRRFGNKEVSDFE